MIKVKVYLNSGNYEYLTYVCKESEKEFLDAISKSNIVAFTDVESDALITIPTDKYIAEVWPHNPEK